MRVKDHQREYGVYEFALFFTLGLKEKHLKNKNKIVIL